MLERDEYGYVVKIVSNCPYHPCWRLTAQLVEGFRDKTGLVSSVGIYSPNFGLGSFENPKMIGRGEVDAGIINPSVTAKLAWSGWVLACRQDMPEELAYLLARRYGPISARGRINLRPSLRLGGFSLRVSSHCEYSELTAWGRG